MRYFSDQAPPDQTMASLTISGDLRIIAHDQRASELFGDLIENGARIDTLWNLDLGEERDFRWSSPGGDFRSEVMSWGAIDQDVEMLLIEPPENTRDDLFQISTDLGRAATGKLDRTILDSLARIGRISGTDRAYLFIIDAERAMLFNTHEWVRSGVDPQILSNRELPNASIPWFIETLQGERHFVLGSLDEMPARARRERDLLESQGIESLLVIGMFDEEQLVGFIGFESTRASKRWSRRSVERLRLVAGLLGQSILKVRTEQKVKKADELFRLIRRATNDIIWDWDLQKGIIERSETMESMLGVAPSDQNSSPAWWESRVHPEDLEAFHKNLTVSLEDRTVTFFGHQYRILHQAGQWLHVLERGYIVRDDEGKPIRVIGVTSDITDRVRSQTSMRESEERLRAVLDNVSDAITLHKADGTIVFASPSSSSVLGYSPTELEGMKVSDLIHPDDRDKIEKVFFDAVEVGKKTGRASYRLKHGESGWRMIETVGTNLLENSVVGGVLMVSRDVNERRRLEQQIERSSRLASLGHLASSIAHEFNNVLMGAQPFVDIIQRSEDLERARYAATKISEALDRGKSISRGILQFARPLNIALETVDLRGWLLSLEDEIRRIIPSTVEIDIEVPEQPMVATIDPVALYQALLNLVLNAREALDGREDARVEIIARKGLQRDFDSNYISDDPEKYRVIVVSDNGPGLEPEALDHIFDPMFTSRHGSGAGLGLAVVQQLIAAQGGRIYVESAETGTTFLLFLAGMRERAAPRDVEPEPREDLEERLILLVEDNEIVASGISAVLQLEGQKVAVARTGAEALDELSRQIPSVVILDIGLPDMSGLEVFDKIESTHPSLPVIFSSGHGDQQNLRKYLDRPNVEFLLKPYDAQTLMAVVERLLSR